MAIFPIFPLFNSNTTIGCSPTTEPEPDPRLIEFPYSMTLYATDYATKIINKYSLRENIDYIRIDFPMHMQYNMGFSGYEFRFKDTMYVTEIQHEAEREKYIRASLNNYTVKDNTDFYIHALYMAKHGTMTVSINFTPKLHQMEKIIQEIISFYFQNDYELPDNAETFKKKFLTTNNQHFTIYLKSEEDAAALLLQISELINIIN